MAGTDRLCNQLEKESETCALGAANRQFVPEDRLRDLMTLDKIKAELRIALGKRCLFWNSSLPKNVHSTSPKVVAILAIIGLLKCAKSFHQEGLTDEDLPLSAIGSDQQDVMVSVASGKQFRTFTSDKHLAGCARRFLEKQWQVLAPVLDASGDHIVLNENCAMPIVGIDSEITKGGASSVFKGTVHKSHFNGFEVREEGDLDIAIKLLEATEELRASEVFAKERENLDEIKGIGSHRHLIRAIATCQVHKQYFILFPWADGGDLNKFWNRREDGSADADLVLWSLKQMEGLVGALRLMHGINHRHGDLKPGNILHFSRGNPFFRPNGASEETLVIADYGVSKRHEDATAMRRDGTRTRATTRSYEAPEADGSQKEPRSRKYDLWSIGCIFLEFATWLLHGNNAVKGFASQRRAKAKLSLNYASFYEPGDAEKQTEVKLNEAVEDAVAAILEDPRCRGDTALSELVTLIPECLLLIDASKRDNAEELHAKLKTIVSKAEGRGSYLFREISLQPDIPSVFRHRGKSERRNLRTVDGMPP